MQTIWSRAIQAKSSCRCPSCLTTPSAITRRPNTAAASRSFRYGDIATFFYSSILATAAVADAERKDAKRKKLDNSITEAVEALKAMESEQQKRLQILHDAQRELRVIMTQHKRRIQALRKTIGQTHLAQPMESLQNTLESSEEKKLRLHRAPEAAGETLSAARRAFGSTEVNAETPTNDKGIMSLSSKHDENLVVIPGEVLRGDKGTPEESVPQKTIKDIDDGFSYKMTTLAKVASELLSYDESSMDLTKGRQSAEIWLSPPWVLRPERLKLMVMNASIAKLVYRLLLMCLDGAGDKGVVLNVGGTPWILRPQHRPELQMRIVSMTDRLRGLSKHVVDFKDSERIPFPRYSNRTDHQLEEDFLDKALRTILEETSGIYDLLPKICYHLMVSKAPPCIHTFNMLIIRLSYLQHYQVASAVIDSLFECNLRPNEITTAAVLRFYDYTNDFDGFKGYIGMMNVEGPDGLITLRKTPEITPENKNHFVIVRGGRYRGLSTASEFGNFRSTKFCVEKAPRNRDTYMALISGWLSFSDLTSALTEYVTMIRSGWKPDNVILTALLSHCALNRRMDWGALVWCDIVETYERPDLVAYYWMLHLCAQLKESKLFDTVLQHGAIRQIIPADMHRETFIVPMSNLETDNRVLEMLRAHIHIPRLAPLPRQNKKVTQQSGLNLGSFLSDALENADIDRLARAREHMANLNTINIDSFENTNADSKSFIVEPYRYTCQKQPPGLSVWSSDKSGAQSVSSVPELVWRRSVASAHVSHIPVEHSPKDKLSQLSKPLAIRRQRYSPSHYRAKAMRKARRFAKYTKMRKWRPAPYVNEAMVDDEFTEMRTWRPAPYANEALTDTEVENSMGNYLSTKSQSPPSISSVIGSRNSRQMQLLPSDNGISRVNEPTDLSSTARSGLLESTATVSSRNADSQIHVSPTIACATAWNLPEKSNIALASRAGETFSASAS
ncbi:hypothetical protein MMC27_007913 [Xylographa pallens]|nr:hypothetical protein [Xylographa pallens]